MPQNDITKEEEEVLKKFQEESNKPYIVNQTRQLFYHSAAFLTSLLPLLLFRGVYSLDTDGITLIPYLGVCCGAAYLLSSSYHTIFVQKMNKMNAEFEENLRTSKNLSKTDKQEMTDKKEKTVEMGATAYSMLFINCIFMLFVGFFGVYMMKQTDVRLRFIVSMLISAFCCNWLSRRDGRVRKSKEE